MNDDYSLAINGELLDRCLIDEIVPLLDPNTKFTLFNGNLLDQHRVKILDDMFQSFCESVLDIKNGRNFLILYSRELNTNYYEAISDLSSILKLINSFTNLLGEKHPNVMMYKFIIYANELFTLTKENFCQILSIEQGEIKFPQERGELNIGKQITYFKNCTFNGESMKSWYKQLLMAGSINNYKIINSLNNFVISINETEEKCMFIDFGKTLKMGRLIKKGIKYEISQLINEFGKLKYDNDIYDNIIYILTKSGRLGIEYK